MNKWDSFVKAGKYKEEEFADCIVKHLGGQTITSTRTEDMKLHIDLFWVDEQYKLYPIDVKAMRKINRSDSKPSPHFNWIELVNVRGDKGWLYGKAAYIAFETETSWLLVTPNRIKKLLKEKVKDWTSSDKKELYKVYSRAGRKDELVLVKMKDLESIANKIIPKDVEQGD